MRKMHKIELKIKKIMIVEETEFSKEKHWNKKKEETVKFIPQPLNYKILSSVNLFIYLSIKTIYLKETWWKPIWII